MLTKEIAYAFAAAAVCMTIYSATQSATSAQSSVSDTPVTTVTTPSHNRADLYRHAPSLAILHKRVDLSFSNETLQKAVEMLSKSSGLQIEIDSRLKILARVSVEAQNVPIYHILEIITHQPGTDCMISPKGNGVILEPWPSLEVNGKKEQYRSSNAPWSDAWDRDAKTGVITGTVTIPASLSPVIPVAPREATVYGQTNPLVQTPTPPVAGGLGGGGFGGGQSETLGGGGGFGGGQPAGTVGGSLLGAPQAFAGDQPIPAAAMPESGGGQSPFGSGNFFAPMVSGMGAAGAYGLNGSLSVLVTALSEKSFVVTEPGMGPKNEFGFYLTVYRVEGDKVREVSRIFHRSANGVPPYTAATRRGGRGPMPGTGYGTRSGVMGQGLPPRPPGSPGGPGQPNGGPNNFGPPQPGVPGGPGLPPSDYNPVPRGSEAPAIPEPGTAPADPAQPPVPAVGSPPVTPPKAPGPPEPTTSDPRGNLVGPGGTSSGDVLRGGSKTPEDPFGEI